MTINLHFRLIAAFLSCVCLSTYGQVIPRELSYSLADPTSVLTLDLNQDSYLDVICSSGDDNKIVWFENLQNDTFGQQQIITEFAMNVQMIVKADINNDGNQDIVSVNKGDNSIMWYRNTGNASFAPGVSVFNGFISGTIIETADFDGDGWIDVIAASRDENRISWFPNNGGVFGNEMLINDQIPLPKSIDIGDIDGSGSLDLICGFDSGNGLYWFSNNGFGVFSAPQLVANEVNGIVDVKLHDIDQDLDLDVTYCVGNGNRVEVHSNLGGGVFGAGTTVSTPDNPVYIDYVDLDADSWQDLLISSHDDSRLEWQKNTAGLLGALTLFVVPNYEVRMFCIEDMDNDYDIDLISISDLDRVIGYHKNDAGAFYPKPNFLLSPQIFYPQSLDIADIDGNGYSDIVYCSSENPSTVGYFPNNGTAAFDTLEILYQIDNWYGDLVFKNLRVADIDGDSDNDIVLLAHQILDTIFWLENDGTGLFSNPSAISVWNFNYAPSFFEVADLDGDNDVDVISCSFNDDKIVWYENLGGGNFNSGQTISTLVNGPIQLVIEDIDGDLDMDIVSISVYDDKIAWYENTGGGTFGVQQIIATVSGLYTLAQVFVKDLDNNGTMDILIGCNNGNEISWYSNIGGGTFGTKQIISTVVQNPRILPTDFDGDGDQDIITSEAGIISTAPRILWLENLGGGSFTSYGPIIQYGLSSVGNLYAGDVDGDGDEDLLNNGGGSNTSVWLLENELSNLSKAIGNVFVDVNQNNIFDSADITVNSMQISSTPSADFSYTQDGSYALLFGDTTVVYTIFPVLLPNWEVTTDSLFYTIMVDSAYTVRDSLDFGLFPQIFMDSVEAELIGGFPRCNDTINYWFNVSNVGTTIAKGIVKVELDDSLTFVSSNPIPDSIVGQSIYWNYDSLMYFADTLIEAYILMPDFNSISDTLITVLSSTTFNGAGIQTYSTADTLEQVLVCAYDPNDKMAEQSGLGPQGFIPIETESIDYTVRFQNTGNDTATVVVVKDQLDANLNWASFEPLAFSDPVDIYINQYGEVTFTFDNIMLPDSNVNELQSHGFLKYRINLNLGLPAGTVIQNSAEIYFDLNPPVITNTKHHTLFDCTNQFENIGDITAPVCAFDTISFVPSGPSTVTWDIVGVTNNTGIGFTWIADTSGQFNLTIHLPTACPQDTNVLLTVNPIIPVSMLTPISICQGDSLLVFGQYQSIPNVYYDSLQGVNGCDSIVEQSLNMSPIIPVNILTPISICEGDSILVFGQYQSIPNVYYDSLQGANGCDSIIEQLLNVNANPIAELSNFQQSSICVNDNPIPLPLGVPLGGVYSGSGLIGTFFDPSLTPTGDVEVYYSYTNVQGCEDSDTASIFVDECLSLGGLTYLNIQLYPNPFRDITTIDFGETLNGQFSMKITDIKGKEALVVDQLTGNSYQWNAENCESGTYYLSVYEISSGNLIYSVTLVQE